MFMTIAFHDVRPGHHDAFLGFMRQVEDAVRDAPGLVDFRSYRDTASDRLVGVARWETQDAFMAAMPTIMGLSDRRRPEWTDADDELVTLTLAGA